MRYVIKKVIEARNIEDALKRERTAEIIDVYKEGEPEPDVGYRV
jgi:hypothetical protein